MRIGPFVPCFIDAFFPDVGVSPFDLLEHHGAQGIRSLAVLLAPRSVATRN